MRRKLSLDFAAEAQEKFQVDTREKVKRFKRTWTSRLKKVLRVAKLCVLFTRASFAEMCNYSWKRSC
jgi:hypothetical protein